MSIVIFPPFTVHSENVEHVCSEYHFDYEHGNWEDAEQYCKRRNYDGLVSMQTEGEWVYFKNIATNITPDLSQEQQRALKKGRWFIGLRYFSHKWCWSSDRKACINQTTTDTMNGLPQNVLLNFRLELPKTDLTIYLPSGISEIFCQMVSTLSLGKVGVGGGVHSKNSCPQEGGYNFHMKLF